MFYPLFDSPIYIHSNGSTASFPEAENIPSETTDVDPPIIIIIDEAGERS
jgi:hypothetical protein